MNRFVPYIAAFMIAATPVISQEAGRLSVQGSGAVETVPDMASISLGVSTEARNARAALAANATQSDQMMQQIRAAGIDPKDMQTSGLSLSPLFDNRSSASKVVGYRVSNQVQIRVRDLDRLGEILDAVVANGANQFHGLSFGLQNPGPAQDGARVAAVKEAMRKAALYAEAAGISLGPVLSLTEGSTGGGGPVMMAREMSMSDMPVAKGEISTRATVTMVFEITP